MSKNWKIKFKGDIYYLINEDCNKKEGAIATKYQYENFEVSFAHLDDNGKIKRYGEVIGNIKDIEFIKKEEV